jgi:hypothetical protein
MTPYLRETHIRWLNEMLEHYSSQEADYRKRLDAREVWGEDGHENEWLRYQAEAAALRAAIEALQPPTHETNDGELKVRLWEILEWITGMSNDPPIVNMAKAGMDFIDGAPLPKRAALKANVVREWHFDRYRNGKLKAQGVKVHAVTEAEAWVKAKELLHIDGNLPTDELRLSQNGDER